MKCTPMGNIGYDTAFGGCENDNNSKGVVAITFYSVV